MEPHMTNNEKSIEQVKHTNSWKWIWWGVGGGLILLCCCSLVLAMVLLLEPTMGETFSGIVSQMELTTIPTVNDFPTVTPTNIQGVVVPDFLEYPNPIDNALGDPNAPVTITEYSDFQCPYCRNFWQDTQGKIIDEYVRTGKVYLIYRSMGNFLGDFGGTTESQDAAMAAYCAGEVGKFWEYHDILFANWNGENQGNYSIDRLVDFSRALNLDERSFRDCIVSQRFLERVSQDAADGKAIGVSGTPSFEINGQLLEGAQPFESFQQIIEKALGNL
jgi:protein-disulfide isomerase